VRWLGVTAVPLNTRLSAPEIDRVLADCNSARPDSALVHCRRERCGLPGRGFSMWNRWKFAAVTVPPPFTIRKRSSR